MWDKGQFANDDRFVITYRYNGVFRTAQVEEVRLSFTILYRLKGQNHSWDLHKKDGEEWKSISPHQMKPDLMKAIAEGIDIFLKKRTY